MQTGTLESTYPVMGGIKWQKTYEAVLATPVTTGDLLVGHLLFVAFRVTTSAALFLLAAGRCSGPRTARWSSSRCRPRC